MSFLAKTWSLKLMTLSFKGDEFLGKQFHVTIKQIIAEPSVIAHCQGLYCNLSNPPCKHPPRRALEGDGCIRNLYNSLLNG